MNHPAQGVHRAVHAAVLLGLAGCVTLTSQQEASLTVVRDMVDATRRAYDLEGIRVLVGPLPAGATFSYQSGLLTVSPEFLTSGTRDAETAMALAYATLPHSMATFTVSSPSASPAMQRSLAAQAKAVDILQRVQGISEEDALRLIYVSQLGFHSAIDAGRKVQLANHQPPCEELNNLLDRFPHYAWTASAKCVLQDRHWVAPGPTAIESALNIGPLFALVPFDLRYPEYVAAIKKRIVESWSYPEEAIRRRQSGRGVAAITITRDGTVTDLKATRTTGVELLDRSIESAIRRASPLPPLPDTLVGDTTSISITFTYNLTGSRPF